MVGACWVCGLAASCRMDKVDGSVCRLLEFMELVAVASRVIHRSRYQSMTRRFDIPVACFFRLSAHSRTFYSHPMLISCPDAGIESMSAR